MLNSKLVARFLVLTLMVSACSKDKETEPSYPITFVGDQYSVKSETRVFTSEGEQPLDLNKGGIIVVGFVNCKKEKQKAIYLLANGY